ncbi:MAG: MarR family transcriptional regulator [Solirubrobacterales bacterium]|nr:MarR family transcriptional regulator [Solirubrobacterales bacterium]
MPVVVDAELDTFMAAFDELRRAVRSARARTADDRLTPSQYDLLLPLLDAGRSLGLRELAEAAGVAPPTATRMLDGLQRRGLVDRSRCADDRRAVRLTLTSEGAALVRERREQVLAAHQELGH